MLLDGGFLRVFVDRKFGRGAGYCRKRALTNTPLLMKIASGSQTLLDLTVVVTVVSGEEALRENLASLIPQIDFEKAEVIIPFDKFSINVGELSCEFPKVNFQFIDDLGLASVRSISSREHRLYDRRRSIGLRQAKGRIIAMTEDHATPSNDWVQQIMAAHEQPYGVIGGAVENGLDRPLNRAWYYCDFGRYGRPFVSGEAAYVSDVNLAYKREFLMEVRDVWREAYHETSTHRALRRRGNKLFLDARPVVFQMRPPISIWKSLAERINWGRIYAEDRTKELTVFQRIGFAAGSALLPALLLARVFRHMMRQKQTIAKIFSTLPLALILLMAWSVGEFLGYLAGEPKQYAKKLEAV